MNQGSTYSGGLSSETEKPVTLYSKYMVKVGGAYLAGLAQAGNLFAQTEKQKTEGWSQQTMASNDPWHRKQMTFFKSHTKW